MFERFTTDARTVVSDAQQHARRMGHRYIGCEHLLLAVVGMEQAAAEVMRESGVTPPHVEQQIVRPFQRRWQLAEGADGAAQCHSDQQR